MRHCTAFLVLACSLIVLAGPTSAPRASGSDDGAPGKAPWPQDGADPQHTGRGQGAGAVGKVRWRFAQPGHNDRAMIGGDQTVYMASTDALFAVDAVTGEKRWEFRCPAWSSGAPAIAADGTVFQASQDGRLHALDPATGEERWTFVTPGARPDLTGGSFADYVAYAVMAGTPTLGPDGTIYIGVVGGGRGLAAVDGRTSKLRWQRRDNGHPGTCPALTASGSLAESYLSFRVLDSRTGDVLRERDLPGKGGVLRLYGLTTPAVGDDGTVYVPRLDHTHGGQLFALEPESLSIRWELRGGDEFSQVAIGRDGTVYTGRGLLPVEIRAEEAPDGRRHLVARENPKEPCTFYAVDGRSGREKWKREIGGMVFTPPSIAADGTVYVGNGDGHLWALDGATGDTKWMLDLGAPVSGQPAIGADGTLYVATDAGLVAIE